MRIRKVLEEYEAQLAPPLTSRYPRVRGKAEWKVYANGTCQGKVVVSRVELPDGARLELILEQQQIDLLTVQGSRAGYRRETERGEGVHPVEPDQLLQVVYAGQVILEGRFYAE